MEFAFKNKGLDQKNGLSLDLDSTRSSSSKNAVRGDNTAKNGVGGGLGSISGINFTGSLILPPPSPTLAGVSQVAPATQMENELVFNDGVNPTALIIGTIVVVAFGMFTFDFFGNDARMWNSIASTFSSIFHTSTAEKDTANNQPEIAKAPDVSKSPDDFEGVSPYLRLTNQSSAAALPKGRNWILAEEQSWRAGVTHQFTYQRLKTVQDVRQARLNGSQLILREATSDKKFWIRMEAVFGLAEFGEDVKVSAMAKVFKDVREGLAARYFERFGKSITDGERLVLRASLPFVNSVGRVNILTALLKSKDTFLPAVIAAAEHDDAPEVKAWMSAHEADKFVTDADRIQWENQHPEPVIDAADEAAADPNVASGDTFDADRQGWVSYADENDPSNPKAKGAKGGEVKFYSTSVEAPAANAVKKNNAKDAH